MYQLICRFLFFKILGWSCKVSIPDFPKCILCVAPHTSNWDFLIAQLFYGAIGRRSGFLMKKEWFFFPLGLLFKAMGGIPVDRGRNTSLTDQLAERFRRSGQLNLAITPEATRKANADWKKGFYYIALKAKVPILLIGIDYPTKTIACTRSIVPTGDYEHDIRIIKQHFTQFRGKKPDQFAI